MRMWMGLVSALIVALCASPASAQQTRDLVRDGHGGLRVQLDVGQVRETPVSCPRGPCPTEERHTVAMVVELHQRMATLAENLHLEFDLEAIAGFTETTYTGASEDDVWWFGSPWLGASIAHRTAAQTMRLSLGIAPPLRTVMRENGMPSEVGGLWGRWNEWLGLPAMVPLGLLGMTEWRGADVDIGIDAAVILAPVFNTDPTISRPANRLFSWTGLGFWLGGHVLPQLDLGFRTQGVLRVTHTWGVPGYRNTDADVQLSVAPFIRVLFQPFFAELRVHLNLNTPYGPPLDANGILMVNLQVGGRW